MKKKFQGTNININYNRVEMIKKIAKTIPQILVKHEKEGKVKILDNGLIR